MDASQRGPVPAAARVPAATHAEHIYSACPRRPRGVDVAGEPCGQGGGGQGWACGQAWGEGARGREAGLGGRARGVGAGGAGGVGRAVGDEAGWGAGLEGWGPGRGGEVGAGLARELEPKKLRLHFLDKEMEVQRKAVNCLFE